MDSPLPSPAPYPLEDTGTPRCKLAKASLLGDGAGRSGYEGVPSPLAGEGQSEGALSGAASLRSRKTHR